MRLTDDQRRERIDYYERHGAVATAKKYGMKTRQAASRRIGQYRVELEVAGKIKKCKECGAEFKFGWRGTHWLYCSDKCKQEAIERSSQSYYGHGAFLELI